MLVDGLLSDNSCQGRVSVENAYFYKLPSPPLSHWLQCFWQLDVPVGRYAYRSVPDNNVDCIFNTRVAEDCALVAPFTSALVFQMSGPVSYFGIRFRVLAQQGLTAVPVGDWGDSSISLLFGDNFHSKIVESLARERTFEGRCTAISSVLLAQHSYPKIDRRLLRFIRCYQQSPASNIELSEKQCAEFGLSSRQLRRLSHLYLGLSPAKFAQVLRFQNMLCGKTGWRELYYDQAHCIREFKRFTGLTPKQFYRSSVLYPLESPL